MTATPRPPAVTLACVFVGLSAFLLLMDLIQALTEWGTIEMQDGLEPVLTTLRERGVELTMGDLLGTLRWIGMASVLFLVSAVVFAVYAARGDRASRVGLTVLAVVTGVLVVPFGWIGVLQAVLLFGAAFMLWSTDARRWYSPADASAGEPRPPALGGAEAMVDDTPAPPVRAARRPRAVLAAGLVTVIGSALVGGLSGLYLVVYGFAREEYVTLIQDGPFADLYTAGELDAAMRAAFWACLVMLPLAAAGLAAGFSLLARLPVGRAATLALAWITAAAGVVLVPFGLLGTGAAVAVIVLLNRAESRAWK